MPSFMLSTSIITCSRRRRYLKEEVSNPNAASPLWEYQLFKFLTDYSYSALLLNYIFQNYFFCIFRASNFPRACSKCRIQIFNFSAFASASVTFALYFTKCSSSANMAVSLTSSSRSAPTNPSNLWAHRLPIANSSDHLF